MGVLFERENEDAVIYGKGGKVAAHVKVPRDRTLLSVWGSNTVSDGEVFSNDGYVYDSSGRRLRKMWSYRKGWNHYWDQVVEDVARIEEVCHRLQQRIDKSYSPRREALYRAIRDRKKSVKRYGERVWIAHVKPWNKHHKDSKDRWWQFNVYAGSHSDCLAHTFDWVDPPKRPVNVDLGEQLYQLDYIYGRSLLGRSMLISDLLDEAIQKYIRRTFDPPTTQFEIVQFHLTINGRDYWYRGQVTMPDFWVIEKQAWPRDRLFHATVSRS